MDRNPRLTRLMGVINVTPDSYYQASRTASTEAAIERGLQMCAEGADWLDIGGESTSHFRKGSANADAALITAEEESARVVPVIKALKSQCEATLSVDTMKPEVAAAALAAGATVVNDISGLRDPKMQAVVRESGARAVVMHMKGTPRTMHLDHEYPDGVSAHVLSWARRVSEELLSVGIEPSQLILDPGCGFGKTVEGDYELLHCIPALKALGYPVLVGLSRKSMIGQLLGKPAADLLAPTIALNTLAVLNGADYLRVHDVAAHRDAMDAIDFYRTRTFTENGTNAALH